MAQKLSNLPIGALVKFGKHQVGSETATSIIWMVADKNHSGYPSNSVTLITQKIIDLRPYDARENLGSESDFNGGINYRISNLNQWLNSTAAAGGWYSRQHNNDTSPNAENTRYGTQYTDRPGFLYNFTPDERLSLLPTTLVVQEHTSVSDSVTAKVFIPSLWETIGSHTYDDGSTQLACFKAGVVTCGLTSQALSNTTSSDKPSSTSVNWKYMTRSTHHLYTYAVSATGTSERGYPNEGNRGLRPMVNLSADAKISDLPDTDGCYTISFNKSPAISGSNTDLGVKTSGFSQTYTITDADNEAVTVKEYVDNVEIRSYVPTLGATNTIALTGNTWLKLANGIHTIKVVATDGFATAERVITFTKTVNTLVVQRTTPIAASSKPTRLIATVVKTIPQGAIFKAYACNNGFDASPTWEDITSEVQSGFVHVFSNTVNTAGKWGVNIKVTVDRNGADGACFITEIGGNFE